MKSTEKIDDIGNLFVHRPLAMLFVSLLLAACQSVRVDVDVASVEEALSGMAVSMPPRDPFAGFRLRTH